jgi:DNA-directed RNA polymerase specialized sigma24 family protein
LHTPELFRPWIYRIASREAFRHLKKQKRRPDRVQDEPVPLEELAISAVAPRPRYWRACSMRIR